MVIEIINIVFHWFEVKILYPKPNCILCYGAVSSFFDNIKKSNT